MKLSNILFAAMITSALACSNGHSHDDSTHNHDREGHEHSHDGDSHGHVHDENGNHIQEEFTISGDSTEVKKDSTLHTHKDGETHHNH